MCRGSFRRPYDRVIGDKCELGPEWYVDKNVLYEAWSAWCTDQGGEPGNKSQFGQWLVNALPEVSAAKRGTAGDQFPVYTGIKLCHA